MGILVALTAQQQAQQQHQQEQQQRVKQMGWGRYLSSSRRGSWCPVYQVPPGSSCAVLVVHTVLTSTASSGIQRIPHCWCQLVMMA
jgi:hypothetical protein